VINASNVDTIIDATITVLSDKLVTSSNCSEL
jgi:hypothetical protein